MTRAARILIVEDSADSLELMRYLLVASKFRVSTASNGEDAIEAAKLQCPDMILCDIQLPGMDGYEAMRRVRDHCDLARIPLVAVTALAMVGDRDKVLAGGFDGYMSKPIDPETFVAEVDAFLPPHLRTA